MNDKELNEIFNEWKQFLLWCYENNDKTIEIHRDKAKYVMDYINKLQFNWNSLREYCKEYADKDTMSSIIFGVVLNKMNELEGKDK